jgi:hypothetical protein
MEEEDDEVEPWRKEGGDLGGRAASGAGAQNVCA